MLLAAIVLVLVAATNGSEPQAQTPQSPLRPPGQQTPGPRPPAAPATPVRDTGGRPPTLPPGTSVLTGTVSSFTGQPVAGARINVNGEGATRTTMTDARGRFSVGELRMGRYYLNVSKPGYITIAYGQRRVNSQGTAIPLGEGETRDIAMQLPRGSVLTGMVLDERGEPAVNASVRAMRIMTTGGERRPQQVGGDNTDDRGIFRIHSLQPGDYAVCAVQRNGAPQNDAQRVQSEIDMLRRSLENAPNAAAREQMSSRLADLQRQLPAQAEPMTGYVTVCFPGSSPNPATTIPLAAGEERANVDLQLQLTTVARVEGTVVGPAGASLQNVQLSLSGADEALNGVDRPMTNVDDRGRFVFQSVAPGRYTLIARSMQMMGRMFFPGPSVPQNKEPEPRFWAMADLVVSGQDVTGVVVELQRGVTISGQVVYQGTTLQPPANLTRGQVSVFPFSPENNPIFYGPNPQAALDASGRFTLTDVVPGKYRVSAGMPGAMGWIVDSITVDGEDALDSPLEVKNRSIGGVVITMIDRITELSGTLADQKGQPATEPTLLLYPTDQKYWVPQSRRIRTTRAGADGHYSFRGVPPGDYRLTTVMDPEPGAWFDKAFLSELDTSSVRITLANGEKRVEHVRIR